MARFEPPGEASDLRGASKSGEYNPRARPDRSKTHWRGAAETIHRSPGRRARRNIQGLPELRIAGPACAGRETGSEERNTPPFEPATPARQPPVRFEAAFASAPEPLPD